MACNRVTGNKYPVSLTARKPVYWLKYQPNMSIVLQLPQALVDTIFIRKCV